MKNISLLIAILLTLAGSAQTIIIRPKPTDSFYTITAVATPKVTTTEPPVTVNAGADISLTLPTSSVTLSGTGTGTISSLLWTLVSGANATITNPSSLTTGITGLTQGAYVFRLTATGASSKATDDVSVTVNGNTTPPPPGYTLTFSSGFDTQADMLYGGNGQYGNGTISTTTYKTGPGSFYSRPANVSSGIRSEVQYTDAAQNPTEGAVEYDVMYEVIVPNNTCSVQWHPYTSGGSGSPYMQHDGGKILWQNWIKGVNQSHTTTFNLQTGKWYHMRMEYKFGSSGYWRHYIDGNLICSWTGQVGDGSGQYLKIGVNSWDNNGASSRVFYDNLRVYKKN